MSKFAIIALFFLFACSHPKVEAVEKPKDLIPAETMVQVLADVHLLEGALNVRSPQHPRSLGPMTVEMHDSLIKGIPINPNAAPPIAWYDIFKMHGVTKQQYETSMQWYSTQPDKLNLIYDDVITELTTRQLKLRSGK